MSPLLDLNSAEPDSLPHADPLATIASQPFEPLAGEAPAGATVLRCPLCNTAFTHGRMTCGSCPMNRGCDLIACPSCGFTFPRTSRIVEWLRRLWRRGQRARP